MVTGATKIVSKISHNEGSSPEESSVVEVKPNEIILFVNTNQSICALITAQ